MPGAHQCVKCDGGCDPSQDCTASGCVACLAGYEHAAEGDSSDATRLKPCIDINECKTFPCSGAETCKNAPGSHSCACVEPATITEGQCQLPGWMVPPAETPVLKDSIHTPKLASLKGVERGEEFEKGCDVERVSTSSRMTVFPSKS